MGQEVKQDLALDVQLWVKLLDLCSETAVRQENSLEEIHRWVVVGAFLAFSFVLSLRGPEGFMLELKQLRENPELTNGLVWLPLVGKLKGEDNVGTHWLRSVPVTGSGIDVLKWRNWLVAVHQQLGLVDGPAICDSEGFLLPSREVNERFWLLLEELFDDDHSLFPKAITDREKIRELIQINRTPRRSAETRATQMNVSVDDKEIVNRWSKEVRANGKKISQPMRLGYSEQSLLDDCFRRWTSAM